ncbi:sensor histidine kinase [Blautia sp. MSJ-9]|uniref:sensor histidine kinase n=1 Tax=Blautia sp. MSJ-9 TaxID=2841511 RepID=UPI001C10A7D3|nr:histidine kinase [Blautia sp. MSJ-9]MBU5679154.1 histidine kinase [Blautia sp. MSJ-9]
MKQKKWTMRNALLVLCISSVVFALLLQTFLFHQSLRRQIRAESISDHEISLNKMQTDLSHFIHTIRGEMLTIYSEQDLINAMRDAAEQDSSMKEYYWRTWYMARKRFTKEDQVLAMYLYDTKDKLISSYRYNSVTYPRDIYKADYDDNEERVYSYVHGDRTDLMISGYHNPEAKKDIIRFVLKLHNYDADRSSLGYLVCDINSAAFTSIMAKYVDVEQVCLWLQPLDDKVIAMTGQASESQSRIQKQLSKVIQDYYQANELQEEYDGNYLIQVSQENYNLEAFVLVSQSLLTAAQKSLIRTLLIIMAAMIAAVAVLVLFVSQWVTRPVEEMSSTITRIKNGEKQLRVQPIGWSQELSTLGTEFNEMLDRMEVMAQEELQHKMLVERTEYKMLQAQINPHFLYNTLDTMSGIANAQNCPLVSGMCRSLSAIFRYSLNMTDELSTLQNEMAHVRNYLYVMDVRNGSTIAYDYQIDSDTLQDPMPRICIQPVVENALAHGLRNVRRKDKKLLIRSEHVGENLVITVQDNGAGMDAEEMNRLLEQNDMKRVESGVSIGILNVNARLKKLFGKEYGLHIESTIGEGTTVTITVPAVLENDKQHYEASRD